MSVFKEKEVEKEKCDPSPLLFLMKRVWRPVSQNYLPYLQKFAMNTWVFFFFFIWMELMQLFRTVSVLSIQRKRKFAATRRLLLKVKIHPGSLAGNSVSARLMPLLLHSPSCSRRRLPCWWLSLKRKEKRRNEWWMAAFLPSSCQACRSRSCRYRRLPRHRFASNFHVELDAM